MVEVSDEQFEQLINEAMDELPQERIQRLDNIAITYEDEPSPEQRKKLKLRCHETLYGLYEGIPLTRRGMGYNMVLPDKITLFKHPITQGARNIAEVKEQVKHTLWHEIAHYYGLDHDRIHELE
jgi:predicted Zn-dependent protease with MMP-like domain